MPTAAPMPIPAEAPALSPDFEDLSAELSAAELSVEAGSVMEAGVTDDAGV